ncbi:hypothetical protein FCI23_37940 [Actinacidiphila oryziradicis]|uniref:Uncharacterized protein n=1 Tax=Actinacidiphila oryziradicis TaxID=2571141 RepID=A0A4U0S3R3_9ACTN|nr:hypothetical protein FCI23_37940 [Actinacidiphila oryziradicis]
MRRQSRSDGARRSRLRRAAHGSRLAARGSRLPARGPRRAISCGSPRAPRSAEAERRSRRPRTGCP